MRHPCETHLKLKSCEFSFARILCRSCQIISICCIGYGSMAMILPCSVQNVKTIKQLSRMLGTNEFARDLTFKMLFGWISFIEQPRSYNCNQVDNWDIFVLTKYKMQTKISHVIQHQPFKCLGDIFVFIIAVWISHSHVFGAVCHLWWLNECFHRGRFHDFTDPDFVST